MYNSYVEVIPTLSVSRENARTSTLAIVLASVVPPFEINLLLLWLQCRGAQILGFLEQAKSTPEHPHSIEKTVVRQLGTGRVQIL